MIYRLLHIVFFVLAVTLVSCGEKEIITPLVTRASLQVNLVDDTDKDRQELIKTIRFIIFDDASLATVKLDKNIYSEVLSPETATDIKVNEVEVTPNDDKVVVVIINEPTELTGQLDLIDDMTTLENVTYDIARILNSSGQEVVATTGMPMVGVIRDVAVANGYTETVKIVVERAVARVDVYLGVRKDSEHEIGYFKQTADTEASSVTLYNLSYNSYFVMGNEANGTRGNATASKNYGKVMGSVADGVLVNQTWTATKDTTWQYSSATGAKNQQLLCSFYTAERIFRSNYTDRLAISMANFKKATLSVGMDKRPIETVTKRTSEDVEAVSFTEIRRNNVYVITAYVGEVFEIDIYQVTVEDWGTRQDIDLDIKL
ncbi:hypothetical protein [uncultured Parabacteroides sp.]|uniref:hypothetical protein n=1 Tax=uncultured Parabacteroides sp. TaxID=512312 RepID=UPI00259B642E|nr:hypothetical protein [uncultured Parabacteroides sp.]